MSQMRSPEQSGASAAVGMDLDLSGRQLGDYRLLRRLGQGAMADVYLAEQGSLRRQVAFKALKRELAADQMYVRRFHLEAQAAAALVHPNIVQIYEVGCADGVHYIAQEYVDGQNLSQFVARHGLPEVKLALAVMRQATAALCKAAERGIVHRDIKPENIMLSRTGEVKVADFGLARTTSGGDDAVKLTQAGITMGTPLYMSPEQVEGRPLDSRCDIYSLGVTSYHMLAGRTPFRGDTALSVALQHVRTQPDRLELERPDLPPALCRIIHTMLAKSPEDRYESPRDLLRELRTLQVDGAEVAWPADLEEYDTVELAALVASRGETTQRLQTVMKHQAEAGGDRRWLAVVAAAVLGALALGAGAAWVLVPPFLLDVSQSAEQVPKQATASAQHSYAEIVRSESAWKAVAQYFPDDTLFTPQAERELAKFYLQKNEPDAAMALFRKFADAPASDTSDRAFGLTGQSIVYSLANQTQQSAEKLGELAALVGGLDAARLSPHLDRQMMQMLVAVLRHTQAASDKEAAAKLDAWLESHFADDNG